MIEILCITQRDSGYENAHPFAIADDLESATKWLLTYFGNTRGFEDLTNKPKLISGYIAICSVVPDMWVNYYVVQTHIELPHIDAFHMDVEVKLNVYPPETKKHTDEKIVTLSVHVRRDTHWEDVKFAAEQVLALHYYGGSLNWKPKHHNQGLLIFEGRIHSVWLEQKS
jgi:hypothetical protein